MLYNHYLKSNVMQFLTFVLDMQCPKKAPYDLI